MQNYRNRHTREHRAHAQKAIDGFLSVPRNSNSPLDPKATRQPVFQERLRSVQPRTRVVGEIKKTDGWYPKDRANRQVFGSEGAKRTLPAPQPIQPKSERETRIEPSIPPKKKHVPAVSSRKPKEKARRQRPSVKTTMKRSALILSVLAIAALGFMFANGYLNLNKILQGGGEAAALETEVDPSKLSKEGDGRINVLLLGRGGIGHDGADLTDTVLLASIDPVMKKAALVSVPRDTWIEGSRSDSKLNAVFANAKNSALSQGKPTAEAEKIGVQAAKKAIETVLGVNVNYYGMIDFKGFERAVNTVGGVEINVPEDLRDSSMAWENNWNPLIAAAGPQTMDGKKALMYVRSRHGSARGDFDRAERQRQFLLALKTEVMSANTYSNPVKVSQLMNDFGDNMKTDFSLNDLMRMNTIMKGIGNDFESIGLVDEPHNYLTTDTVAGQSVVVPKAGTFDYEAIQSYIRKALPDGYIVRENAPVTVLNGTTKEGVGSAKADELRSYAYNVRKVENAPTQDYQKTVIVDLTGKNKYTLNYLERRFGTKAVTKIPEGIAVPEEERNGFIVIIGQNETLDN